MILSILGVIVYFTILIFIKINNNALTMREGRGKSLVTPFSIRTHFIINLMVGIFFWYIFIFVIAVISVLLVFDSTIKEFYKDIKNDYKDEKHLFRLRFNVFKFLRIEKLYKSSDNETRTLLLETLYNYMKWNKEELN